MEPAIQRGATGSGESSGLSTTPAGPEANTNASAGRRQKRPAAPATTTTSGSSASASGISSRPLQPLRPYAPRPSTLATLADTENPPPPPAPAKRGRKPGPLSRSAREAQRRLNHSIIEKARRTKINEALADLKSLVPVDTAKDLGANGKSDDDDDDDNFEDDDYAEGSSKASKTQGKPKKEQKEKEFKLEILIRTVTYLRTLVERVAHLEAAAGAAGECAAAAVAVAEPSRNPADPLPLPPNSAVPTNPSQSTECPTCKRPLPDAPSASLPSNSNRGKKRKRSTSGRIDNGSATDDGRELSDEESSCSFPTRPPLRRRARILQDAEDIEMESNCVDDPRNDQTIHATRPPAPAAVADPVHALASPSNPSSAPIPQPLPPLSAWLACVLDSTSEQPTSARLPEPKTAALAYPSPPESVRTNGEWNHCGEKLGNAKGLPYLNLGPRAIPPQSNAAGERGGTTEEHARSRSRSRPTPPCTPEDESAASLLLGIASSPPLLPWPGRSPPHLNVAQTDAHAVACHTREVRHAFPSANSRMHAETPSSLLGLDIGGTFTRRP